MPKEKKPKEKKVKEKKREAKECEKCKEHIDGWKRAMADYDNLKKDLIKEREQIRKHVKEDMAHEIITVLDNFDQAVKFVPENLEPEVKNWITGITHVRGQLESVLTSQGVEPSGEIGEIFDPNIHEAIGERTEDDKLDQQILEIQLRGWKLGDRIIRPAKTIINQIINKK
jgi:molecular chaperone GrpE